MEGRTSMNGLIRRALVAASTLVAALAVSASPASAGILTVSAKNCNDGAYSKAFSAFGDRMNYKLVEDGDFESKPEGWTLLKGAKVVNGNEPWKVGGKHHGRSLSLPNGSTAISAPVCVGLAEPTVRFFAAKQSGLLSTLAVTVYVKTSLGLVVPLPLGVVLGNGQWKPSSPMLILANLLPLLPQDRTPVAFGFTPILGSWTIDDVYVDPMRMR
jgi:hypothetical protein